MNPKTPFAECESCSLRTEPFVPGDGADPSSARLVLVGEAPGREEVDQGRPFVGPSGKLLMAMLKSLGVSRDEVYLTNAVLCRPPNNRDPTSHEMKCCRTRLMKEVEAYDCPKVALGRSAMHQLDVEYSHRGYWDRDRIGGWHPAYILRQPNRASELYDTLWKSINTTQQDLIEPTIILGDDPTFEKGSTIIWDLECDNVDWYNDDILCLAFTTDGQTAYVIDDVYGNADYINKLLSTHPNHGGHNIRFDQNFLAHQLGIHCTPTIDTMLMHSTLKETVGGHDLKGLAAFYFDAPDYESDLVLRHLKSRNDRYSKVPRDDLFTYAALDVCYTFKLNEQLEREVRDGDLWSVYEFNLRISNAVHKIEQRGIAVDVPYLSKVVAQLETECDKHEAHLQGLARKAKKDFDGQMTEELEWAWDRLDELNPRSPQQNAAVMFDLLGLPKNTYRRSGERSTDVNVLENLKGRHPFIDELATYRKVHKLLSSYASNIMGRVEETGRVHPEFKGTLAETGRLRSFYHTIPRPGDPTDEFAHLREQIRKSHIASKGNKLIVADYSQAELRIAAAISGEPFLLDAFARGDDIHTAAAEEMYGDDYTKEQRVWAKMLNFSFLYGGSEYSFAHEHQLPVSVARARVRRYMEIMPVLTQFRSDQFDLLRSQGYISTRMGRKRRFPLITNDNYDEARKAAISVPCQGGAADITNEAVCECIEKGWPVVLSVHDSILADVPTIEAKALAEMIKQVMLLVATMWYPEVKWEVDYDIVDRWGEKSGD